jgi:hypothetical protein
VWTSPTQNGRTYGFHVAGTMRFQDGQEKSHDRPGDGDLPHKGLLSGPEFCVRDRAENGTPEIRPHSDNLTAGWADPDKPSVGDLVTKPLKTVKHQV